MLSNAFSLHGKIALVTGGGSGIGLGIAKAMIEAGAKVIIAKLLDNGTIKTILTTTLNGFTVENIKEAHRLQESGKTIGKTVVPY